jgi:hypothetical protein
MAAEVFQMDPESAATGLAAAAAARISALAADVPAMPVDNYYSGLATVGIAVLLTISAEVIGLVEQGSLTSAISATQVETAEDAENAPLLST